MGRPPPQVLARVRVMLSRSVFTREKLEWGHAGRGREHTFHSRGSARADGQLNRPSHSQAHRDFAAWRLIRDAFAVRERLRDPRVVPSFRRPFFPDMPPSMTPGSFVIVMVQFSDADHGLRQDLNSSALPWPGPHLSKGDRDASRGLE